MKEVEILLDRRWVLKRQHPELYFKLRDQYATYQEFFKEKLGYRLIINPLLIKAEKLPGEAQPWMGIQFFESPLAYVYFSLVLMFLEEKQPEEQFVLEQVTAFVQSHYPEDGIVDWTVFSQRRALTTVLRFCVEEGIVVVNDGDDRSFEGHGASSVLYENTGASKYFMRHFPFDLSVCNTWEEILNSEWQGSDLDRGIIRRHRVYRKLAMNPVVYQNGSEDQDYLYLKNQRSVLAFDFEKYLPVQLHVHKNGAMLMFSEGALLEDGFPNRRNVSDVTLHLCASLKRYYEESGAVREGDDSWVLSEAKWTQVLEQCVTDYSHGWGKAFREDTPLSKLKEVLLTEMGDFGMLKRLPDTKEIRILPAAFKFVGRYPEDYIRKRKENAGMPSAEASLDQNEDMWEALNESMEN